MSTKEFSNFKPRFRMPKVRGKPAPVPPEFAEALGKIVVEWSRFEQGISVDTSTMMHLPQNKKLADTAPINFTKRIALWKRCIDGTFDIPEYRNLAASIKMKAVKVAKIRNHLVHGFWALGGPDKDGAYTVINTLGLQYLEKYDTMKVDQSTLDGVLKDICELSDEIFGFITAKMLHAHRGLLKASVSPLPDHPAPQTPSTDGTP